MTGLTVCISTIFGSGFILVLLVDFTKSAAKIS